MYSCSVWYTRVASRAGHLVAVGRLSAPKHPIRSFLLLARRSVCSEALLQLVVPPARWLAAERQGHHHGDVLHGPLHFLLDIAHVQKSAVWKRAVRRQVRQQLFCFVSGDRTYGSLHSCFCGCLPAGLGDCMDAAQPAPDNSIKNSSSKKTCVYHHDESSITKLM